MLVINAKINKLIEQAHGGVGLQHVTKGMVENLEIPLPPLAEQKRIADILDKANEIKAKRELALAKLDELAQITFIEMFGDPLENPMKWHFSKLKDITVFENGDRSSNYPSGDEVIDSGVLFLSTKSNDCVFTWVLWAPNNGRKNCSWGIISRKASLAHS